MKDYSQLNNMVYQIADLRYELSLKSYEESSYDELEDKLHDLEDSFIDGLGDELEEILSEVYDELCPNDEVLSPLAYLATTYKKIGESQGLNVYEVEPDQGLLVSIEGAGKKNTRLVVLPNPLRVLLNVDQKTRYRVWPKEA
jgi:hypothetical protein